MSSLAEVTVFYSLGLALVCLLLSAAGRPRPAVVDAALSVVALAALGITVLGLVSLARGHRPYELATHVGYLVTAPLILPAAAGSMQGDRGRWSSAAFATGCLVLVVVLVRLVATSRGPA